MQVQTKMARQLMKVYILDPPYCQKYLIFQYDLDLTNMQIVVIYSLHL